MPQKRAKKNNKKKKAVAPKQMPQRQNMLRIADSKKVIYHPRSGQVGQTVGVASIPPILKTYTTIQAYADPKQGITNGLLMKGCGPIAYVSPVATGGASQLGIYNTLSSNAIFTKLSSFGFPLNPWTALSRGSAANMALAYTRFAFKKVKIHWVGVAPTSTAHGLALGYLPDGGATTADFPTYSSYLQLPTQAFVTGWNSVTMDLTDKLNIKDWYYVDYSVSPDENREYFQGIILGHANGSLDVTTTASDVGFIYIEYEVILIEPTVFDSDFVLLTSPSFRNKQLGNHNIFSRKRIEKKESKSCDVLPDNEDYQLIKSK